MLLYFVRKVFGLLIVSAHAIGRSNVRITLVNFIRPTSSRFRTFVIPSVTTAVWYQHEY